MEKLINYRNRVAEILPNYCSCYNMLNSSRPTLLWFFTILRESLNVWLYYLTFVCGVMASSRHLPPPSSSTVLVVCCRCLSSSAMSNDLGHRLVDHLAGVSAHLTHRRRCPELTSEAQKTSITSPLAIFSGLGSRYPSPVCHHRPRVHRSLAYKLTAPP